MPQNWKTTVRRALTSRAVLPCLITICLNFVAFYGARAVYRLEDAAGILRFHDLSIPAIDGYFEANVRFFRWFIIIYIFYFIFWFAGYWINAGVEKSVSHPFFAATSIGLITCAVIFILFPTAMEQVVIREEEIETVFDRLALLIYRSDEPNNLFPSIHCFTSYMIARYSAKSGRLPKGYKLFCIFACAAIFASTLFVRQHLFADLIGAAVLGELSILAERLTDAGRLFDKLDQFIRKENPA